MANVVSSTIDGQPFFLQKETGDPAPIYYSATDMRHMLGAILRRGGCLGESHLLVQQAANVGMSIKVNSGYYMAAGYLVFLPTDQTLDLSGFNSSPAATRTHPVYLSIYDGQIASTATYAARLEVVEDVGGATGPPPLATLSVLIASISVGKNQGNIQNKDITDKREHGGMSGQAFTLLTPNLNGDYAPAGTASSGGNPRAHYGNGVVRLNGAIQRSGNGGNFAVGTHELGTLTASLRPPVNRWMPGCMEGTGASYRLQIKPDGSLTAVVPTGASPQFLFLDGITYDLD